VETETTSAIEAQSMEAPASDRIDAQLSAFE
jgi:hypothetical protein